MRVLVVVMCVVLCAVARADEGEVDLPDGMGSLAGPLLEKARRILEQEYRRKPAAEKPAPMQGPGGQRPPSSTLPAITVPTVAVPTVAVPTIAAPAPLEMTAPAPQGPGTTLPAPSAARHDDRRRPVRARH